MSTNKDYEIKDSGSRSTFLTGAQRDDGGEKGAFELLPFDTITALAIHYQKGAKKYAERNWEKGIPVGRFLQAANRHLYEFGAGWRNENHLIAALWNVASMYQTILWMQDGTLPADLYNLPRKVVLPDPHGRWGLNATPEEIKKAIEATVGAPQ